MQTQRDHVHAHTFTMGRLSSALIEGDPTGAEIPGRRAQTGLLIGIIVLVLVAAGFAVYGLIVPGGSKAYRQAGAILVEKETGDRYVYLDGALHPVTDLTSAMLIQGARSKITMISAKSLKDLPRGVPLGIVGAPGRLPASDQLVTGPWVVCLPDPVRTDLPDARMGVNLDSGVPTTLLPEDRFLVVRGRGEGASLWIIANHVRHRVLDDAVLVALGAAATNPAYAPWTWLKWLPEGPQLGPAAVPGSGRTGFEVGGQAYPVGTLFRQGDSQLFVLREDGLAPISRTEFLIADAADSRTPVDLDAADLVQARRSADKTLLDRLPDLASLQLQDTAGQAVCQQQTPVRDAVSTAVALVPQWASGVSDRAVNVQVRGGSGMVVTPVPAASKNRPQKVAFISDEGIAYDLVDNTAVSSLKFSKPPIPIPKDLLAALPQGPALSRNAVTAQVRG